MVELLFLAELSLNTTPLTVVKSISRDLVLQHRGRRRCWNRREGHMICWRDAGPLCLHFQHMPYLWCRGERAQMESTCSSFSLLDSTESFWETWGFRDNICLPSAPQWLAGTKRHPVSEISQVHKIECNL